MLPPSKSVRTLLASSLLLTFLSACVHDSESISSRSLPPAGLVVMDPAPKAFIGPGDDARLAYKLEEARADDNAARLVASRGNYEAVASEYARGQ